MSGAHEQNRKRRPFKMFIISTDLWVQDQLEGDICLQRGFICQEQDVGKSRGDSLWVKVAANTRPKLGHGFSLLNVSNLRPAGQIWPSLTSYIWPSQDNILNAKCFYRFSFCFETDQYFIYADTDDS